MDEMKIPDEPSAHDEQTKTARPLNLVNHGFRQIVRQFLAILGVFLIMVGVPLAMLTPFPFVPIGLPVVLLGVSLLGRNSVWGRRWMEGLLVRYPTLERFAPNWLMKLVFGRDKEHLTTP